MENTIENKARFFAQYYGQKVVKFNNPRLSHFTRKAVGKKIDFCEGYYLELRPISLITHEDAENAGISKKRLKQHIQYPYIMTPIMDQILRSKGYALPFMGLSVDEIVRYGWAKLGNKKAV